MVYEDNEGKVPAMSRRIPESHGRNDKALPWTSPGHWIAKFRNAFRGLASGVAGESSFLVHCGAAATVVVAGFVCRLSLVHWCLVVLCIGTVLAAELFNTALERLARVVVDTHDDRIGTALDIASAAVLIIALAAAVCGAMVFVDALWARG